MSVLTAGAIRADSTRSTRIERLVLHSGLALVRWSRRREAARRVDRDDHLRVAANARARGQRERQSMQRWYLRS